MKKKNIFLVAILVLTIVISIATAIQQEKVFKKEENFQNIITSFLAGNYIWDESQKKIFSPEYMEVSYDTEFCIMFLLEKDYRMYYLVSNSEPDFFIEKTESANTMSNASWISTICKRLKYGSCILYINNEYISITKIRIKKNSIDAYSSESSEWFQNLSYGDFILA